MADGYDQFDRSLEGGNGGSFMIGLLAGTVLGAGLGMLFAPKPGSDLRHRLSEQATEGYRRASESAGHWAERGREMYAKASEAVSKGTEEAQRYVRDTQGAGTGTGPGRTETGPRPTYSTSGPTTDRPGSGI